MSSRRRWPSTCALVAGTGFALLLRVASLSPSTRDEASVGTVPLARGVLQASPRQPLPYGLFLVPLVLAGLIAATRTLSAPKPDVTPPTREAPVVTPILPSPTDAATVTHTTRPAARTARATHPALSRDTVVHTVTNLVAERVQSAAMLRSEAQDALRSSRLGEAWDAASACLRRNPDDPECLHAGVLSLVRAGRLDDARPLVQRCVEDHDDGAGCLVGQARLAIHDRDLMLAGISTWRLAQLAPDDGDTLVTRAQLSELQGDTTAALRSYRAACDAGERDACDRADALRSAPSAAP